MHKNDSVVVILSRPKKTIHICEKSCARCKEKIEEDHRQRLVYSFACNVMYMVGAHNVCCLLSLLCLTKFKIPLMFIQILTKKLRRQKIELLRYEMPYQG